MNVYDAKSNTSGAMSGSPCGTSVFIILVNEGVIYLLEY